MDGGVWCAIKFPESDLLVALVPPDTSLFTGKPSCLPAMQESVLNTIQAWVFDTMKETRVFLLHGKAGGGTSTVRGFDLQKAWQLSIGFVLLQKRP